MSGWLVIGACTHSGVPKAKPWRLPTWQLINPLPLLISQGPTFPHAPSGPRRPTSCPTVTGFPFAISSAWPPLPTTFQICGWTNRKRTQEVDEKSTICIRACRYSSPGSSDPMNEKAIAQPNKWRQLPLQSDESTLLMSCCAKWILSGESCGALAASQPPF